LKRLCLSTLLLANLVFAQNSIFVLCEGNFNTPNASLWKINGELSEVSGPIHWNENTNPLGDTGQSLAIAGDKLYVVVNNSHTLEILDLSSGSPVYESTIPVPFASPRYMEIVDGIGYLTCWYLNGILRIDLISNTILDTISVDGMPEDILHLNDKLYVSIPMTPSWATANSVHEIDISGTEPQITNSFEVIPGPGLMTSFENSIYVSSTYYDADWNSYYGISKITPTSGEVVTRDFGASYSFGTDIAVFQGEVYITYLTGAAPLTDSLTVDESRLIGNFSSVYSMAAYGNYLYFGLSDYVAPDDVYILDSNGNTVGSFRVGAIPGAFAFYDITASTDSQTDVLQQPRNYSLNQNYPNPFNARTSIEYMLPVDGDVALVVYSLTGEKMIDLVLEYQRSGSHCIQWDGKSANGRVMPSGLYIYRLTTPAGNITKKMVYLR